MNPSTWVSHNSLRIYCTSSSELVSVHTSVEALSCAQVALSADACSSEIMALDLLDFAHFKKCSMYTTHLVCFKMFCCLPRSKAAPLSINVSCNMTDPSFAASFKDFMSISRKKKKFDGQFVNSSSCQSFIRAVWL